MRGGAASANASSAKGATVRGTLEFARIHLGEAATRTALAALPRDWALERVIAIDDVPYQRLVALWDALEAEVRETHPTWAEAAGSFSIESLGVQLYGGILRKPTPSDFLTQSVSLFRLFYAPGDMRVVHAAPDSAVLRLIGFEPVTPIFCRRQVGGLARALELAGGRAPRVRHVRCVRAGDAFCEWELHWG